MWLNYVRKKTPAEPASGWNRLGYAMSYVMVGSPMIGGPNWGLHSQNYTASAYFTDALRGGRHGKAGANSLFADGHVQQLNKEGVVPFLTK